MHNNEESMFNIEMTHLIRQLESLYYSNEYLK